LNLKKIDIIGFKSFADKIVLNFDEGITTIIGPNGSGKSNIVDAMKWVLGEQSAKSLRGTEMEDVLFKGNENRRASNFASVTVTLRNENRILPIDFNEVSITRKLFRDGTSEYLINNNPARLKDIVDLIADSGINKSGYSILSQGEIDIVLKNNPVERRVIFEEASGIMRFKNRKKIALNKLKSVDEDLVRLKDILLEKERYLNSLQKQVAKARRYKELKEELLKKVEVNYKYELKKLIKELKEKEEVLKKLEEKRGEIERSITINEANIEIQKDYLSQIRDELFIQKSSLEKINKKLQDYEIELNNYKNKKENNIIQITRLKRRNQENDEKEIELKNIINKNKEEEEKIRAAKNEAEQKLNEIRAKFEKENKEYEKSREEYNKLQRELQELKSLEIKSNEELIYLKKEIESYTLQKSELKNNLFDKEKYINEIKNKFEVVQQERKKIDEYINNLKVTIEKGNKEILDLKKEEEIINNEINKIQKEISQITGQLNLINELNQTFEGYLKGVKYFLKDKKNEKLKLLTDYIEVKAEYEAIIENYLSEKLQILLVEEKEKINSYLEEIKNNKLTNVYFYLNNASQIKVKEFNNEILKEEGIICFAREIIKCPENLNGLINYLFEKVVIIDRIENVLKIADKYDDIIFLTLNGEVYNNGILIVNKKAESSGLIKRKREKKELIENIEKLQNQLKSKAAKLENIKKEITNKEYNNKKLSEIYQEKIINLRDLINDEKTLNNEIKKSSEDIEKFENRLNWFDLKEKEIIKKIDEKETILEQVKINKNNKFDQFTEKEELIKINEKKLNEIKNEVYTLSLNYNNYKEQANSIIEKNKILEEQLKKIIEEKERNQNEIKNLENDIVNIESKIKWINELTIKSVEEQKNLQILINKININEKKALEKLDNYYREKENLNAGLKIINEKYHIEELNIKETGNNINSLKIIAKEKYTLSIEPINEEELYKQEEEIEDEKIGEIKEEIKKIEERLNNIGSVNIEAINEYEELKKEFDFIIKQKEDLEKAESDLKELIRKIDKESKEKFVETFNKAKENFSKIIGRIFEGGEGELKLLDEDNVLESGIDIIVRMPGKKFQTITLLSGGERSMVAIALLFSLFEIKPSPFCILDEIDAALDDVNILRFLKLVQEFKNTTQFIIITHNKLTMEMSDNIYGVSMEEAGISKVLSFRFEKEKKEEQIAN